MTGSRRMEVAEEVEKEEQEEGQGQYIPLVQRNGVSTGAYDERRT